MSQDVNISGMFSKKCIPMLGLLDVTHGCNLTCEHCCVVPEGREELSLEGIKDILDQLHAMNTFSMIFSGGEVLTRPDIFDILAHARSLNFRINVYTNGTLLDSAKAEELKRLKVSNVGVSIYGHSPEVHDGITGVAGSHAASVEAIRLLQERGLHVSVKTTIMSRNFHELTAMHEWAQERRVFHELSYMIMPQLDQGQENLHLRLSDDQCREFLSKPWVYGFSKERLEGNLESAGDSLCSAAVRSFNISPHGDVYPCVYLRRPAGNLKERSFADIWWNSPVMQELRAARITDLRACSACELRGRWCNVCMGLAWLEHGDWREPAQEACRKARLRREIYGDIVEPAARLVS